MPGAWLGKEIGPTRLPRGNGHEDGGGSEATKHDLKNKKLMTPNMQTGAKGSSPASRAVSTPSSSSGNTSPQIPSPARLSSFSNTKLALVPAPCFIFAHAAQPDFVRQLRPREGEQHPPDALALVLRRDEELIRDNGRAGARPAWRQASVPPSSATWRLQPFSISIGMRARSFASRKLLASSSPG